VKDGSILEQQEHGLCLKNIPNLPSNHQRINPVREYDFSAPNR